LRNGRPSPAQHSDDIAHHRPPTKTRRTPAPTTWILTFLFLSMTTVVTAG
jgi:hypothetical protein